MSQELKNCPFCGGDELSHGWNYVGIQWAEVECHNDDCQGHIFATTESEAIEAWNRRAPDPLLAEAERALERLLGFESAGAYFNFDMTLKNEFRKRCAIARTTLSKIREQREG